MAKLFIYLPTYNRPESLRRQLTALLPQVEKFPQDVRVLISDNASNKYIQDDILRGLPTLQNVEVRRNGGNIEGNANIALGFVFARPDEFLWILSDNDILSSSAVSYLMTILDIDVDFYCFILGIDSMKEVQHDWKSGWQIPMDWRMGLISDALYNMNTVRDVVREAFFFHNSSFPHLAVACAAGRKKGVTRFRLLPRQKLNAYEASSKEQPTDYSVAQVGMPLLAPLFPPWEAKSFSRKWLWSYGIMFHIKKSEHPNLYIQSTATLRRYGGWPAGVLIFATGVVAFLTAPYLKRRSAIVKKLKTHISSLNLERIKRVRRFFAKNSIH